MGIATILYKHKLNEYGEKTGSYNYAGQKPTEKVLSEVKNVLSSIKDKDGCNAKEAAEWISPDCKELFPAGEPFASMRYGANEGYLVHVFSNNRSEGVIHPAITIKYLSDKYFVYQIARELNEALNDGLYLTEINEE